MTTIDRTAASACPNNTVHATATAPTDPTHDPNAITAPTQRPPTAPTTDQPPDNAILPIKPADRG